MLFTPTSVKGDDVFDADRITQDVIDQMRAYLDQLQRSIQIEATNLQNQNSDDTARQTSDGQNLTLEGCIRLLARVANGEVPADMADDLFMGDVTEAVDLVCKSLFGAPGNPHHYPIPPQFWDTELGQAIRHCQLWLRGDDLITYTEAASLLWPDDDAQVARMRIKRMVERGELSAYADPNESNRQRAGRVSRQEITQRRH